MISDRALGALVLKIREFRVTKSPPAGAERQKEQRDHQPERGH